MKGGSNFQEAGPTDGMLSKEEPGHSFINDHPLVFQVELDAPLLESVRPDDHLICESWRHDEVIGYFDPSALLLIQTHQAIEDRP